MNESKKMLEIIHANRKRVYEAKKVQDLKEKKADRQFKVILCVTGIMLMIVLGALFTQYSNSQIESCVKGGHNENWCIKNT